MANREVIGDNNVYLLEATYFKKMYNLTTKSVSSNVFYLLAIGSCFGFFLDFLGLLDLLLVLQRGQIGAFL